MESKIARVMLFTLLMQCVLAAFPSTCFEQSQVYGLSTNNPVSDISHLRSSSFQRTSLIKIVTFCGTATSFEGIQLTLKDPVTGLKQVLNPIGRTTSCEDFTISDNDWITSMTIRYASYGVNHFAYTTFQGLTVERGIIVSSDLHFTEQFTNVTPIIGFNGFESSTKLTALGFIRFLCQDGTVPDRPEKPITKQSGAYVIVDWSEPVSGTPIQAYVVEIRKSDRFFSTELTHCDGSNPLTVLNTQCTIPASVLNAAPFSQPYGALIYARVAAINLAGQSETSLAGMGAILTTFPDPPTSLAESARTDTTLTVTWKDAAFNGGQAILDYILTVESTDGKFSKQPSGISAQNYLIEGLSTGVTYKIIVKSRNAAGNSQASGPLTITLKYSPQSPTSVLTQNQGDQVKISWKEPFDNASPITAYKVFVVAKDSSVSQVTCASSALQTQCLVGLKALRASPISLLANDKVKAFVVAQNAFGDSGYSLEGSGAVIWVEPSAPQNLQKVPDTSTDTQVGLSWQAPLSDGGSIVLDYSIYYLELNSGLPLKLLAFGLTELNYTVKGLTPGKTYRFRVQARNVVGAGELSQYVETLAAVPPDAPTVQFTSKTAYQIQIAWQPGAYNGGSPVIDYEVQYRAVTSSLFKVHESNQQANTTVIPNLEPGTRYEIKVRARNAQGYSAFSATINVLAAQVPDQPHSLVNVATVTNYHTIGVEWSAPFFDGGSPVIDYTLWMKESQDGQYLLVGKNITVTQFVLNDLTTGTQYSFSLQARNQIGLSAFSQEITITAAFRPLKPTKPTITQSLDTLIISWDEVKDGGSPVTSFDIKVLDSQNYKNVTSLCVQESLAQNQCTVSTQIFSEPPFTQSFSWGNSVNVTFAARNQHGLSVFSDFSDTVQVLARPDSPLDFQENPMFRTKSTLGLKWNSPQFLGGAKTVDFTLSIQRPGQTYQVIAEKIQNNTYVINNLVAGTIYSFKVQSRTAYGLSSYSNVISILCAAAPDKPSSPTVKLEGDQALITWIAPLDNGASITQYIVSILQHNSTTAYIRENDHCTGSALLSQLQCFVPLSALTSAPYLLVQGEDIVVRVEAVNFYGISLVSDPGSGDTIKLRPDKPTQLKNDLNFTSSQSIRFTWQDGESNGGSPVIDYQVYYTEWNDQQALNFVLVTSTLKQRVFTTQFMLTPGRRYVFKVTARNLIGVSPESENIVIYAATVPDAPTQLAFLPQYSNATQVSLTWLDGPSNGGVAIGYYTIILQSESLQPVVSFSNQAILTGLEPGTTYDFSVASCNPIGCGPATAPITVFTSQVPDPPINVLNMPNVTNASQIGLSWSPPVFKGGLRVLDYQVWQRNDTTGDYRLFASNVTGTQITIDSLKKGVVYSFKLKARNSKGVSEFSSPIEVLTAQVPNTPKAPITTWLQASNSVLVTWTAPDYGGSPITHYSVFIRASDNITYIEELDHCLKVKETTCQVPASELIKKPFNLVWGSQITVKVIAANIIGNSSMSDEGSGAVIITSPEPPTLLSEMKQNRTKTSLGLFWSLPQFDGGSPVIDYRISVAEASQPYKIAVEGLTKQQVVVSNLTTGLTYNFIVEARNAYGYSAASQSFQMLCAYKPEPVDRVDTYNELDKLVVHWSSPTTNGSPITRYIISIQPHGSTDFIEETTECNGTAPVIIQQRECAVHLDVLKREPYNLVGEIKVQIVAVNQYGQSLGTVSTEGSGGVILHVPDAPTNLQNDLSVTTDTVIKITWAQASQHSHEGAKILDFSVYFDRGVEGATFVKLAGGITDQSYVTGISLVPNKVYTFKVSARNQVGESELSQALAVRAAGLPSAPSQLKSIANQTNAYQITLSWSTSMLYDGGSPIIDYRISQAISQSLSGRRLQDLQYSVVQANIKSDSYTVGSLTPGVTYSFVLQSRNLVGYSDYSKPIDILAAQVPNAPINLVNDVSVTSGSQIGIKWTEPIFDGGSDIIDYRVLVANEGLTSNEFVVVKIGVTQTSFTYKAVIQGEAYSFKVEARNAYGLSQASTAVKIVASEPPTRPDPPVLAWSRTTVTISWQQPNNGGVSISSYRVLIRTSDGETYLPENDYCQTLQLSCQVPVSVLRSSPYDLPWGSNVHAKVIAINSQGSSQQSLPGSGVILITNSGPPANLAEDSSVRTKATIGIMWSPPQFTGGSDIIDYRISSATDGVFSVMEESVPTTSYTVRNIVPGQTMSFKVQARNQFGYSVFSDVLSLTSGYVPDAPWGVVSQNVRDQITVTWFKPVNNGAPITAYKVFIRKHVSSTYAEVDPQYCDGASAAVLQSLECKIRLAALATDPFNLAAGEQIYAKIVAINLYGHSAYSETGFGSVMKTAPDPPFDLKNDITVTSEEHIKFTWRAGLSNGGSQIIDYTVYFDQGFNEFIPIAYGVINREYTTQIRLNRNQAYQFKVSARNDIGNSTLSEALSVTAQVSELLPTIIDSSGEGGSSQQKGITAASAATAGAAFGVTGLIIIVLVTILVTGLIILLCCGVLFLVARKKYPNRVFPFTANASRRVTLQGSENKNASSAKIVDDLTDEKIADDETKIEKSKTFSQNPQLDGIQNLSGQERIDFERNLLKGKTAKEKIKLLNDLQRQRQQEFEMQYKLERQQLRHDHITATRRIEEQENIDNIFRAIYAQHEVQPQDQQSDNTRKAPLNFLVSLKSNRADDEVLSQSKADEAAEDIEALFFANRGTAQKLPPLQKQVKQECDLSDDGSLEVDKAKEKPPLFKKRRLTHLAKQANQMAQTQKIGKFASGSTANISQKSNEDDRFLGVEPNCQERQRNRTQIVRLDHIDLRESIVADEENQQLYLSSSSSSSKETEPPTAVKRQF